MNLDELRSAQDAERRQSDLQSLRESFYAEAGEYVASLKEQRDRAAERASDPFSDPEVKRLSDEIETAEGVIESIYERRMGKLLDRASLAAADMSVDEDGLTAEERELFRDLVGRIRENKSTVLDTVSGEESDDSTPDDSTADERSTTGMPPETATQAADDGVSAADVMGESGTDGSIGDSDPREETPPDHHAVDPDPAPPGHPDGDSAGGPDGRDPSAETESATPTPGGNREEAAVAGETDRGSRSSGTDRPSTGPEERVTVQITEDVGEIFGVDDREYELATDDVVQLPEQNATPLVERDAAERLD